MATNDEYKKLIGKKCCFCKKKLTLQDWKDDNISKLVGGSCPPKGKPMHNGCYNRVLNRLFR
jgi:Zn ribbon nucleic-acid-binding protein